MNQYTHLGQTIVTPKDYKPGMLTSIERPRLWGEYNLDKCPYTGTDVWNAYELSWLNSNGLPQVAIAEFTIPFDSTHFIESKSFKLYLNSLNNVKFDNWEAVEKTLNTDLSTCINCSLVIKLYRLTEAPIPVKHFKGHCIDNSGIHIKQYDYDPSLLICNTENVSEEKLYSHLFRSVCPVTGQPDWASVYIEYSGQEINQDSLLEYIVSYREHADFHEQCTEMIFLDILKYCKPEQLTVHARFLRRGGLDINPWRSTLEKYPDSIRLNRQ